MKLSTGIVAPTVALYVPYSPSSTLRLTIAISSQGELNQMHPTEIGHAAAYEAYRTWIHNSSIYEPLSGDMDRQREGLIGLAIAEGTCICSHQLHSS
jgi:hypothetical protein